MEYKELSTNILGVKLIPKVTWELAKEFKLKDYQKSIGIMTVEIDLPAYTAFDEATKHTDVEVVYAKSTYCGHNRATTKLAGEFIGVIAGPSEDEVKAALDIISEYMKKNAGEIEFANNDIGIPYYAHLISKPGSFFTTLGNLDKNDSACFVIAPPLEAVYAIDYCLKAADVKLSFVFEAPTATNFGGAIFSGSESSCKAAADAFKIALEEIAKNPLNL